MNHAGLPSVPLQGAFMGAVLRNAERHMDRPLRTDSPKIPSHQKIPHKIPFDKDLGVLSPFFREGAKRGLGQRPKVFLLFINLLVLSRRHAEFFLESLNKTAVGGVAAEGGDLLDAVVGFYYTISAGVSSIQLPFCLQSGGPLRRSLSGFDEKRTRNRTEN